VSACRDPPPGAARICLMAPMSIQLAAAFVITSFAGTLMFLHGLSVRLLDRRPTRCKVCGGVPHRTCRCRVD
jgi:hypothetical protein